MGGPSHTAPTFVYCPLKTGPVPRASCSAQSASVDSIGARTNVHQACVLAATHSDPDPEACLQAREGAKAALSAGALRGTAAGTLRTRRAA